MGDFFVGLDLGQSSDPTALAIAQKLAPASPPGANPSTTSATSNACRWGRAIRRSCAM
jgi:hypothetical protein